MCYKDYVAILYCIFMQMSSLFSNLAESFCRNFEYLFFYSAKIRAKPTASRVNITY